MKSANRNQLHIFDWIWLFKLGSDFVYFQNRFVNRKLWTDTDKYLNVAKMLSKLSIISVFLLCRVSFFIELKWSSECFFEIFTNFLRILGGIYSSNRFLPFNLFFSWLREIEFNCWKKIRKSFLKNIFHCRFVFQREFRHWKIHRKVHWIAQVTIFAVFMHRFHARMAFYSINCIILWKQFELQKYRNDLKQMRLRYGCGTNGISFTFYVFLLFVTMWISIDCFEFPTMSSSSKRSKKSVESSIHHGFLP